MGIHGLFSTKYFGRVDGKFKSLGSIKDLGEEIELKSLAGKKICVDASWMIYSTILAMEMIDSLTDKEGNITSHINTILSKVLMLQKLNIEQIWIFDSPKPNDIKKKTQEKREARRKEALEKKYKNSEKMQFKLTGKYVDDIKELLSYMGVMYIVAPEGIEAEQYGAYITRDNEERSRYCEYMLTGDSDVLCFGGNLLRIESERGKSKKKYKVYELNRILNTIGMDYDQFLAMCVMLGSDFADKTAGIGANTAMKKVLNEDYNLTPRQELAIKYFKSEITHDNPAEVVGGNYNYDKLVEFLKEKKFNIDRIQNRLTEYDVSMGNFECDEEALA